MKIIASCEGDPSVGIPGDRIECEIDQIYFDDNKDCDNFRDILRKQFESFVFTLFDELPAVWFSDECPDCRKILINGICPTKTCIAYQPKVR